MLKYRKTEKSKQDPPSQPYYVYLYAKSKCSVLGMCCAKYAQKSLFKILREKETFTCLDIVLIFTYLAFTEKMLFKFCNSVAKFE